MAVGIVAFLLGIIAIILIHELGHYLVARAFGFRVLEYFIGFGPRLFSWRRGEIEYGLKAIPAGGYVKIAGMNPLVNDVPAGDEDRAYEAKPRWQRALVILAGPLSHLLVAFLVFTGVWWATGEPRERPRVIEYVEDEMDGEKTPALLAGLQEGDVIVAMDGIEQPNGDQVGDVVQSHAGEPFEMTIDRDGELITVTLTPVETVNSDGEDVVRIGVLVGPAFIDPIGPFRAAQLGVIDIGTSVVDQVVQVGRIFGPEGLGRMGELLFTDEARTQEDPASIVGISQQLGRVSERGEWAQFFYGFAYICLFIGLLNLLPLPPFDGGHLAVLAIEKVRGKRVDMKKLIPVSAAVLSFFVLFTLAAVYLDVWKPIPDAP
jgi:membrane-associated protease RseP (regulator of RpoE activity)